MTYANAPTRLGRVQLIDAREQWEKMLKSLGEKRKRIPDDAIADITRWYEDFADTETSKVFDNEAFGFRRITVERPLRVRVDLAGSGERLDALVEKVGEEVVAAVKKATASLALSAHVTVVEATAQIIDVLPKLPAAKKKLVLAAFLPRDPNGEVVTNHRGEAESDPALRDQESVPLTENVEDYIAREVIPHAPDAWVDDAKTVVGYEISLTRYFYKHVEPRPLGEIDAEIAEVEKQILQLLEEVGG